MRFSISLLICYTTKQTIQDNRTQFKQKTINFLLPIFINAAPWTTTRRLGDEATNALGISRKFHLERCVVTPFLLNFINLVTLEIQWNPASPGAFVGNPLAHLFCQGVNSQESTKLKVRNTKCNDKKGGNQHLKHVMVWRRLSNIPWIVLYIYISETRY